MLYVKDLSVKTADSNILKDLSLKVKKGEVHAIMGPNGSGKSTLAKVISGHPGYEVTEGTIKLEVNNKKIDLLELDIDERSKRGIFTAFQTPVSVSNLSNFKFFYSFFEAHCAYQGIDGMSEPDFRKHLTGVLKKLDVDKDFLERNMNEGFSGGERKKNEIVQMLLIKPRLAVLDEIDSGLDIDSLKLVADCINSYRSNNNAVVMITHYQRILNHVKPDFVHVISEGKIVKTGDITLSYKVEEKGYDIISKL